VGCKTVFATHYHELTQLADELVAVRNYNVLVREVGEQVLFLHTLAAGGADRSYGIEVGRLAGLPGPVLSRAREVLKRLEGGHVVASPAAATEQLPLFAEAPHPVLDALRAMDPDGLTPRQALEQLAALVDAARRPSA
jgi:DNA mismatch repair protein MutS